MGGKTYIGISGWNYSGWKTRFYEGVPQKRWLEHAAEHFNALEANAPFYRLQSEKTFKEWKARTPDDVIFTAKGHRFATHSKKLKDPDETVVNIRENMRPLEPKLRVVVWQLPERFARNDERLEIFVRMLNDCWTSVRHSIELRHPSWFDDQVADILARHDVAVCQSDAADWAMWDAVTTDLVYVRLHGHTRTYASSYSGGLLDAWADSIRQWTSEGRDVHVYFDNDSEGAAPYDALRLIERL